MGLKPQAVLSAPQEAQSSEGAGGRYEGGGGCRRGRNRDPWMPGKCVWPGRETQRSRCPQRLRSWSGCRFHSLGPKRAHFDQRRVFKGKEQPRI